MASCCDRLERFWIFLTTASSASSVPPRAFTSATPKPLPNSAWNGRRPFSPSLALPSVSLNASSAGPAELASPPALTMAARYSCSASVEMCAAAAALNRPSAYSIASFDCANASPSATTPAAAAIPSGPRGSMAEPNTRSLAEPSSITANLELSNTLRSALLTSMCSNSFSTFCTALRAWPCISGPTPASRLFRASMAFRALLVSALTVSSSAWASDDPAMSASLLV
jgi:hypothetical protein